MAVEIDSAQFWKKVNRLVNVWSKSKSDETSNWFNVSSFFIVVGKSKGDDNENASEMLMNSLIDCTLTDTVIVFTEKEIVCLASGKKLQILEQLKESEAKPSEITFTLLEKNNKEPEAQFPTILTKMTENEKKQVGFPENDKLEGSFAPLFIKFLKASTDKIELKNITSSIYSFLSFKTEKELDHVKKSSQLATRIVKYGFVKRMEDIIDDDLTVTHKALSEEIAKKVRNPSEVRSKFNSEYCDVFLTPVLQSGKEFDFNIDNIESKNSKIEFNTIVFSVGCKYKDYASYVARTLLVGPTKFQERTYTLLVDVHKTVMSHMRPGKTLGEVYNRAIELIKARNESILEAFLPCCGYEIGLGFNKSEMSIEKGNEAVIQAGMTFGIRVGFLKAKFKEEEFSCLLGDTIVVKKDVTETLTKYSFKFSDIMYEIEESGKEESEEEEEKQEEEEAVIVTGDTKIKRSLRSSKKTKEQIEREKNTANMEKQIRDRQKELIMERARLEQEKLISGDVESDKEDDSKEIEKRYPSAGAYPTGLIRNQLFCDTTKECVFIPINGYHMPFHISTIKTVSKTDEEYATLLRFNFFYPSANGSFSKDISKEMKNVIEKYPQLTYIKEMTFKSKNATNLNKQYRIIKELQKKVRARRKKREQQADLVEQADLILNQTSKKPRLRDISMKPALHKGKCIGTLTAHTNGFRFRSIKGESFDLIYSNIKHFIFQPCDHELIVLVHCHLKHPVMVGSKTKTRDVQFYAEAVDSSTALDSHRRTMYDPDEIDEEYRERQLRKRLNKAFKNFCDQVISVVESSNQTIGQNNEYDIPYRNLGFKGVPHKEMVLLQPTVNCLINVTETPFFVVSLDEIEHIHFERTDFRVSKSFDMVFILKKHMEPDCNSVPQRLQTIPVDKFELIKEWIHEKGNITFTCGTTPLNWKNVMIGVREELELKIFWSDTDMNGEKKAIGWNFLAVDDVESEADEEEEVGVDSAFEDDESEPSSEDWSADEASSSEEDAESSEEEGEDWDELDKKAAASDRKREQKEKERDVSDRHSKKTSRKRRR